MNGITITQITGPFDEVFDLILHVFDACIRPDYTQEGAVFFVEHFVSRESEYRRKVEAGKETVFGALDEGKLVGVITISEHGNISCAFVDPAYHGRGIGKDLFRLAKAALDARNVGPYTIRLNASPYAVPFYQSIGFREMAAVTDYHGVISTPMAMEVTVPLGRYRMRTYRETDTEALYQILSDAETMRYIELPYSLEQTKAFLQEQMRLRKVYALTDMEDKLLGQIIFHPYDTESYEIGWILSREYWNRGIATEVTGALIEHATPKGIRSFVIECHPDQKATMHIARKFCFSDQGVQDGLRRYSLEMTDKTVKTL